MFFTLTKPISVYNIFMDYIIIKMVIKRLINGISKRNVKMLPNYLLYRNVSDP